MPDCAPVPDAGGVDEFGVELDNPEAPPFCGGDEGDEEPDPPEEDALDDPDAAGDPGGDAEGVLDGVVPDVPVDTVMPHPLSRFRSMAPIDSTTRYRGRAQCRSLRGKTSVTPEAHGRNTASRPFANLDCRDSKPNAHAGRQDGVTYGPRITTLR